MFVGSSVEYTYMEVEWLKVENEEYICNTALVEQGRVYEEQEAYIIHILQWTYIYIYVYNDALINIPR